ncbi:MAG: cytochrome c oxidase accessory protein CcoG [Solirubrobacterales bacterium]
MKDAAAGEGFTVRQPTKGEVPFYKERGKTHPRAVEGPFRKIKWWAGLVLLAWWHLGPFLRWDRGPGAPDQAILVDMAGRRAYFFDIEIWPQEVYYITGILLLAAVTLFLMSALAGRVWCGFLCWQTVYTDAFIWIEQKIVGDRTHRMELERAPWSARKLAKVAAVNAGWLAVAAACGIGFTLWFDDAFAMLRDIFTGEAGSYTYVFITVIGGFCYLLAGHARERVCVYMCPYSRFQSAMFDEHSLIVSYEAWRGEPRGPHKAGESFEGRGHCVDCRMCVTSCPTGVDIRFGNQLACIGCGLCIDACNAIMDKHGLPHGLISYDSSANLAAREKGETPPGIRAIRPRTLVYGALLAIIAATMLTALLVRSDTEVNVLHERAPLYVEMSDGTIRNGYVYKVLNMVRRDRVYTLTLDGPKGAVMEVVGQGANLTEADLAVAPDTVGSFRVFVNAPTAAVASHASPLRFVLTEKGTGRRVVSETMFAGPD